MKKIYTLLFTFFTLSAFSQIDSVYYHDYIFESQYGASGAYPAEDYMQMITRFTPPYYPARLIGVRVWFRNAVQPSLYKVVVREDASAGMDANNSAQVYISPTAIPNPSSGGTPDSAYTDYIDLSAENLIFNAGDVYAGITQNMQVNGFVGFALDTNSVTPFTNRHWISTGQGAAGTWWQFYNWAFMYARFGITAFFSPVSTSVETEVQDNGIKIFPNPADESLVIRDRSLDKYIHVRVFDSNGKKVFESYFSDEITINTKSWNTGLYRVTLNGEKTIANLKAVVIH
jgi:hypothetical protein